MEGLKIKEQVEKFLVGDGDLAVEITDMIATHYDVHADSHADDTW
jgi:hypothetical protein